MKPVLPLDAVPAAFTLPDLEFLNEDLWMYELDWMDLPESPTKGGDGNLYCGSASGNGVGVVRGFC